jgi:hypothetical protein
VEIGGAPFSTSGRFLKNGIPLSIPNTYQTIKDTNTTTNGKSANAACFE